MPTDSLPAAVADSIKKEEGSRIIFIGHNIGGAIIKQVIAAKWFFLYAFDRSRADPIFRHF